MDTYTLTFIWQFGLFTGLFLWLHTSQAKKLIAHKQIFTYILIGIVVLQLGTAALQRKEIGDVMLFSGAGWHLRHQIDFYWIDQTHNQYPFFPFLIFLHAFNNLLTETFPVFTFSFYLKIFLLIALHYLGYRIYHHKQRKNVIKARILWLQFLTAPVTYAVVLFHGQIDVILIAFFFLTVYWLIERTFTVKTFSLGAIAYTASIAAKTWSVVFLPLFLKFQKNVFKTFGVGLIAGFLLLTDIVIYTRLVDGSSVRTVLPALFAPGGPVGIWGISYLASSIPNLRLFLAENNLIIFGLLYLVIQLFILKSSFSFWKSCFLTVLGIYIILPNWGVQYLFWIMPFLFINKLKLPKLLTSLFLFTSSVYVFFCYINISSGGVIIPARIVDPIGLSIWLLVICWFIYSLSTHTAFLKTIEGYLKTVRLKSFRTS